METSLYLKSLNKNNYYSPTFHDNSYNQYQNYSTKLNPNSSTFIPTSIDNRYYNNDRQNSLKYCPPRFAANGRNSSKSVSYFGEKNNTQSPYNYTPNDKNYNYQNVDFDQKYNKNFNNQNISNALNSIKACVCPNNGISKCTNLTGQFFVSDFGTNNFKKVDFVALVCTNNGCIYSKFDLNYMYNVPLIHKSCLLNLENDLVAILKNSDATLGYSDRDRRARLWDSCNQWIEKCSNFGNFIKCHECSKHHISGYLKPNPEFNLETFLEHFKNFKKIDYNQNFVQNRQRLNSNNFKEPFEKVKTFNKIVHKPRKLPQDWSITPIAGKMTGTLQNFEITEPWLNDKSYPKGYENLAFDSEVEWLKAKLKYQKICNSNKNLREGNIENGESLSVALKNIDNSEYESMSKVSFPSRTNFDDFKNVIKVTKLNSYNVMMEVGHEVNGQSFGIDDLRKQILSNLAHNYCNSLACTLCSTEKKICHEFPLIAGLMYLSDEKSSSKVQVQIHNDGRICYLHSVCLECCQGMEREVFCKFCSSKWSGNGFTMGTLYMFDVFACFPCCSHRKICKDCSSPAITSTNNFKSFSSYSQKFPCQSCGLINYHLVHNTQTYAVKHNTPIQRNKFARFESNYQKQRRLSKSPLENLKEEDDIVNSIFNQSNKVLIQNTKPFKTDFKKSMLNKILKPYIPAKISTRSPEYSSNSLSSSGLGKSNSVGNSVGSNEELSPILASSPHLGKMEQIFSNNFSKSKSNSECFAKSSSIFDGPCSLDYENDEILKQLSKLSFEDEKCQKNECYDVCDIFCRPVN